MPIAYFPIGYLSPLPRMDSNYASNFEKVWPKPQGAYSPRISSILASHSVWQTFLYAENKIENVEEERERLISRLWTERIVYIGIIIAAVTLVITTMWRYHSHAELLAKAVVRLMKRAIFEEFIKTGQLSAEDQEFCDRIDWSSVAAKAISERLEDIEEL